MDDREPADTRLDVMVLGTYHMADPGTGIIQVETEDVLEPRHQTDLERIADAFADWQPDCVAVEVPHSAQNLIDDEYVRYRNDRALQTLQPSEELVQLGFRISDKLDASAPLAVDDHVFYEEFPEGYSDPFVDWWNDDRDVCDEIRVDFEETEYGDLDIEAVFDDASIPQILERLNRERVCEYMTRYRYRILDWEINDTAKYISQWQTRNVHIVHNLLANTGDASTVLLLIGAGHVLDLKHVIRRTPSINWTSPREVLSNVVNSE